MSKKCRVKTLTIITVPVVPLVVSAWTRHKSRSLFSRCTVDDASGAAIQHGVDRYRSQELTVHNRMKTRCAFSTEHAARVWGGFKQHEAPRHPASVRCGSWEIANKPDPAWPFDRIHLEFRLKASSTVPQRPAVWIPQDSQLPH